ncbi:MAG: penicillin-binding protein activator LpoB [Thermoanaerobaculia bacterium]
MKKTLITLSLLSIFFAACSSTRYGDAKAEETVNINWGSTDLQQFSAKMASSMIEAPQLAYMASAGKGDDKRIVMYMGGIRNETTEHINLESVADSIRVEMQRTGKFRFVATQQGQGEITDQLSFQNDSNRVNPEMAKQTGKQLGADVVLYGRLYSIGKKKGRSIESGGVQTKDLYYHFVFDCVNIETGEIIWTGEDEIRKTQHTGLFG